MRATTLNLDVVTATWTHPTVKVDTTSGFDQKMTNPYIILLMGMCLGFAIGFFVALVTIK